MRRLSKLMVLTGVGLAMLIVASSAIGDLPMVRPPQDGTADRKPRPPASGTTIRRGNVILRDQRQVGKDKDAAAKNRNDAEADLDVLIKWVSDTKRPACLKWADRLKAAKAFGQLTHAQQNRAVPKLLPLLADRTTLSFQLVLPNVPQIEVRHRASAALTQLAMFCPGRMPTGREAGLSDKKRQQQSDAIAKTWKAWWQDVAGMNAAERAAAASRRRCRLLLTDDAAMTGLNLTFATACKDVAALDPLSAILARPRADIKSLYKPAIAAAITLCKSPKQQMILVDLLRRVNVLSDEYDIQTIRRLAKALTDITGIRAAYEQAYYTDASGNRRSAQLIRADRIESWVECLTKRSRSAGAPAVNKTPKKNPEGSKDPSAP